MITVLISGMLVVVLLCEQCVVFDFCCFWFFFFKQKTAYEMRIMDWSSDVCSSDLAGAPRAAGKGLAGRIAGQATACGDRTEPGAAPEHLNAYNFLFYSEFLTLQSLKQSFIGEWTARFGEDAFVQFGMFG